MIPLPRDFQDFLRLLNANAIRYLVIGGYAVAYHGHVRYTGDLKKIVCIHGEEAQCLAHAETLRAMKPKAEVIVPEYKQAVEI